MAHKYSFTRCICQRTSLVPTTLDKLRGTDNYMTYVQGQTHKDVFKQNQGHCVYHLYETTNV